MLYLTGYLTKARRADYKDDLPDGMAVLMIPNAEIKEIFETTVIKWFDDSTRKCDRNALFDNDRFKDLFNFRIRNHKGRHAIW